MRVRSAGELTSQAGQVLKNGDVVAQEVRPDTGTAMRRSSHLDECSSSKMGSESNEEV